MALDTKSGIRLFKVSRELNLAMDTLVQHLNDEGFDIGKASINTKISDEMYLSLLDAFAKEKAEAERHKRWEEERQLELEEEQEEEEEFVEEEEIIEEVVEEDVIPEEEVVEEIEEIVEALVDDESEAEPTIEEISSEETEEEILEVQAETEEPELVEEEEVQEVEEVVESSSELSDEIPPQDEEMEELAVEVEDGEEQEQEEETTPVDVDEIISTLKEDEEEAKEEGVIKHDRYKLEGTKVLGKVDLSALSGSTPNRKKRRRKRKEGSDEEPVKIDARKIQESLFEDTSSQGKRRKKKREIKVSEEAVDQSLQETLQEMQSGSKKDRKSARIRRKERRQSHAEKREQELHEAETKEKIIRVLEFVTANELSKLMDVSVNEIIGTCLELGMMVSINQRLDADTISLIADEYKYEVEFIKEVASDDILIQEDKEEDLLPRAPVVTIMGHVDHGKTSLLDFIRSANVVSGEAGGITQHIGAYKVKVDSGETITFLDTPGHEAFTAMRARGAQATDIVILVVAADDSVMPQTIEAINHSKAAGVPIVVAINKMDKPDVNPDKVMAQLAEHGVIVEDYSGNVQVAKVSAKTGMGIDALLEKVILEAEVLELKANPNRNAVGVIIESRLDKGRGTVATVLVQKGTLKVGDIFVAGAHNGRVRAMFNEHDERVDSVGPAEPALLLGFNGQPDVGDQLVVMEEEREAREIAQKRQQIHREQQMRTRKHITLDEIGRRLALGDFHQLNIIIKADVGGSAQALEDSLLKISTEEVQVNVIHSGVGAITESDVLLATASDAVIIGFQVRPMTGVRKLAEQEEIDIRLYSVIYDAINDVRDALEGMLSPEEHEKTNGVAVVRETFKVPKVGTIAGSFIQEGKINRNDRVRLVRDGVVIYEGKLTSLRRFKDNVSEVTSGYECGIGIENYNDIKVGDHIEAFEIYKTKRVL